MDFIGFRVNGPGRRAQDSFKADHADWKGWTATAEGGAVYLEGEGRRIEVPRGHCQIEWEVAAVAMTVKVETGSYAMAFTGQDTPKKRGRPPKVTAQPVETE